jgi:tetratricopeptide (TPR) repeat protein
MGAQTRPRTPAEKAWDANRFSMAAAAYLTELSAAPDDERAWYNAGTAALAAGQAGEARRALSRAAASTDPGLRFRALFNLGYLALREASADSANRDTHLDQAERVYREALLLRPHDRPAKWNLELAVRRRRSGGGGSSNQPPPPSGGGSGSAEPEPGSGQPDNSPSGGLSRAQAEQILQSIGQEELRTRRERTGGQSRGGSRLRVKDW